MEAKQIINIAPVKPETASGVKKITTVPYRGFAANDPRVDQGCSDVLLRCRVGVIFYQNDHLGTPQRLMRISGATVWQGEYDAFGNITETITQVENPLRFGGQYHDKETGFYQNWNRYYSPRDGRYISSDRIGLAGGMNTFGYAYQSPIVYSDPTGEIVHFIAGAYIRCAAGCMVGAGLGYAAEQLLSGCGTSNLPGWGTLAGAAAGCLTSCLNPFNWIGGKGPKGKGPKQSPPKNNRVEDDGAPEVPKGLPAPKVRGKSPGQTVDPTTGTPVGRFITDSKGNTMIEPVGGSTVGAGRTLRGGVRQDTHTTYPNGSTFQRLNASGHGNNPTPHGHGHGVGTGPGMRGQGSALDINGNVVPRNSPEAHWPAN